MFDCSRQMSGRLNDEKKPENLEVVSQNYGNFPQNRAVFPQNYKVFPWNHKVGPQKDGVFPQKDGLRSLKNLFEVSCVFVAGGFILQPAGATPSCFLLLSAQFSVLSGGRILKSPP